MGKCIMCPHCESWFFPEKGVSLDDCPKCGRTVEVPPDHIADANKKVQTAPAPLPGAVTESIAYLKNHLAFEADRKVSEDQFLGAVQMRMMRFAKHFRVLLSSHSDLTRRLAEAEAELHRLREADVALDVVGKLHLSTLKLVDKATARAEAAEYRVRELDRLLNAMESSDGELRQERDALRAALSRMVAIGYTHESGCHPTKCRHTKGCREKKAALAQAKAALAATEVMP